LCSTAISPIGRHRPDQLRPHLLDRVRDDGVAEVIVATDADIEGEATAIYLQRRCCRWGSR
jgi:recombination protein RecR